MSSTLREGSIPAKGPNLVLFEKYPRPLGIRANPHQNDEARSGDFLTSGNFGWLFIYRLNYWNFQLGGRNL